MSRCPIGRDPLASVGVGDGPALGHGRADRVRRRRRPRRPRIRSAWSSLGWLARRAPTTGGPTSGSRRGAEPAARTPAAGPAIAVIMEPNTRLTQVITGSALRKLVRQRDGLAEPLLGLQVAGDVGSAEPVDRLLRVADHEQRARRHVDTTRCRPDGGRSPPAIRSASSIWIGSVSWNSSSSRCGNWSRSERRTSASVAEHAGGRCTSRSWNSSSPVAARSCAASTTRRPTQWASGRSIASTKSLASSPASADQGLERRLCSPPRTYPLRPVGACRRR